jgi:plastocyanin/glucose/arabinose dehydrogenase
MVPLARPARRCAGLLSAGAAALGLVLMGLPAASAQTANDILVPSGYQVREFATGFTAATAMDRGPTGDLYVLDSGSGFGFDPNGAQPPVKIWRVSAANGSTSVVYDNSTQPGLKVNALGIAVKDDDNIFVNDSTGLNRVRRDGSVQHLLDLPVQGDHNADHIVIGKDGMLYWGQGSATNSGVVGEDNDWVKKNPEYHDMPCKDVTLSGQNFTSGNHVTGDETAKVVTGPYLPFGTAAAPGQVVKGVLPCTSSILRANTDGSNLQMVAWGFRNPYGLAFAPDDSVLKGALVVANNGADVRGSRPIESDGDDLFVVQSGGWYGWPDVLDEQPTTEARFSPVTATNRGVPQLLTSPTRADALAAVSHFQKGVSADGFAFSTSDDFGWKNDAFVAEWGSLGFGSQPPEGLPGFDIVHVHFATLSDGVLAGTSNGVFIGNRIQGSASTNGLNGLEHPIDVRFSADGKTMFVLDYGVGGKTGSGRIWAVTRTGAGAPGGTAPAAAPAPTRAPTPAPGPTPPAAAAAPAPSAQAPGIGTSVVAQNFTFNPQDLTVPANTKVTWTNPDTVEHTVTFDDRSVDSGLFGPGQTFEYTFTTPGTYSYFCIPHGAPGAGMHGTINVTEGP